MDEGWVLILTISYVPKATRCFVCYFIRVLFSSCFPVFTHRALCDSYNSYLIHTYHYFINLSVPVFVIHIIYWTVPL